ncbi:uncharacterized protein TRAVEDRAFT_84602, partial [Trametes versicolor FP-101664 SS1]|uniref:uncharacterized protein n=1 Tax=Trametes versicolor (strain FP-101664) TaxID=717944 RepID=UPI0004621252
VVKIVNALSGAAELGGPAVCAYLLGNPDHYTNELFKVFHWRSYVRQVREDTEEAGAVSDAAADRVMLGMSGGGVVPLSKINDYKFRPRRFAEWTLYDFLRLTDVRRLSKKEIQSEAADPDQMDVDVANAERFLTGHPLRATHGVYVKDEKQAYILNFVGGTPPRPDRGDREEYCCAMLTLFHPGGWRVGHDMRPAGQTWTSVFERTRFESSHIQIMKNMNLLYECLDARDDYSA